MQGRVLCILAICSAYVETAIGTKPLNCKLPNGATLIYGQTKDLEGKVYACVPSLISMGSFAGYGGATADVEDTRKKVDKEDADAPFCVLPDGNQVLVNKFRPSGDTLYRCTLKAKEQPTEFCEANVGNKVALGEAFEAKNDGFFKCETNNDGKLVLVRQSCFNSAAGSYHAISKVFSDTKKRIEFKCIKDGPVFWGCLDRKGVWKAPRSTWKSFTNANDNDNKDLGYTEKCVQNDYGSGGEVSVEGCFNKNVGDMTVDVGCYYKSGDNGIYCRGKYSWTYKLQQAVDNGNKESASESFFCTKNGPVPVCVSSNEQPRAVNSVWLDELIGKKKDSAYINKCVLQNGSRSSVEIIQDGCYYLGRIILIGCYHKVDDWHYAMCEKVGNKPVKFKKFHTLLSTMFTKDCGPFQNTMRATALQTTLL